MGTLKNSKFALALIAPLTFVFFAAGCASSPGLKNMSKKERAQMLLDIAQGALMEGDPTGALENLEEAQNLAPEIPAIYHSKALAFAAKKDFPTAILNARKAVLMDPKTPDSLNTLGRLLMDSGHASEAAPYLEKAASNPLYREQYKPLTNLGIAAYRAGDSKKASAYFNRAIEASPGYACHAYYYNGHIALAQNLFSTALKNYERATQRFCAGFVDAHLAIGIAYQRNQKFDLARKKFLSVQTSFPNSKGAEKALDYLRYLP